MDVFVKIVFPVIGVIIILFCLLSYVLPFGARFKEKVQKIKGFGIDIEVSVVTLFILIGFILAFIGIFLNVKSYEDNIKNMGDQIKSIVTQNQILKETIEGTKKMEVNLLLKLEIKDNVAAPKLSNLKCEYFINEQGRQKVYQCEVRRGIANNQFQISFKDIQKDTTVWKIVLRDNETGNKWVYNTPFSPCVPELKLGLGE
jgi:hypothetical protein